MHFAPEHWMVQFLGHCHFCSYCSYSWNPCNKVFSFAVFSWTVYSHNYFYICLWKKTSLIFVNLPLSVIRCFFFKHPLLSSFSRLQWPQCMESRVAVRVAQVVADSKSSPSRDIPLIPQNGKFKPGSTFKNKMQPTNPNAVTYRTLV